MEDVIDRALVRDKPGDIMMNKLEVRVPLLMRDVVERSGEKIIDGDDTMAFREEPVTQMRA